MMKSNPSCASSWPHPSPIGFSALLLSVGATFAASPLVHAQSADAGVSVSADAAPDSSGPGAPPNASSETTASSETASADPASEATEEATVQETADDEAADEEAVQLRASEEAASAEPVAEELAGAIVVEEREDMEAESEHPLFAPSVTVGVGLRTGLELRAVERGEAELRLWNGLGDQYLIRPFISGKLNEWVSAFVQFEIGSPNGLGFNVLDAILQVRFMDELQVWLGQHLPAQDRNNTNGPYFHSGWNFPIGVQSYPFETGARDRGLTVWGLVGGGVFKYHLSAMDLQPGRGPEYARYGARVTFELLEPENFYYTQGTYYGAQDVLAIGGALQYQQQQQGRYDLDINRDGSVDNEFFGFSLDVLFEKNFGSAGTLTLEGGYWDFSLTGADYYGNQGSSDVTVGVDAMGNPTVSGAGVYGPLPGRSALLSAGWLSPDKIGIGNLNPYVRYQGGWYDGQSPNHTLDVGLGYIIDSFNHRWFVNYRHVENEAGTDEDVIQIGAQIFATISTPPAE